MSVPNTLERGIRKEILDAQRSEITEHIVYERLARTVRQPDNRKILERISRDEFRHYEFWKKYTGEEVKPSRLKILKYLLISRIFGITFGIKLMERGEERSEKTYERIAEFIPDAREIRRDEEEHEKELMKMIDEERLNYISSMVLGLNDALVELTGALAGFTFAFSDTRLIALSGLITGVAASLSMASSEYLSTKSEEDGKNPLKAAAYTGVAYILTVLLLVSPYLFLSDARVSLTLTILLALSVIFVFTFYISVAKDVPFKRRFAEMVLMSLGVACLTFLIGSLIENLLVS